MRCDEKVEDRESPRATQWSSWGDCSVSCGGGIRRRSCFNAYGQPAAGCTGGLPTQPCNTRACGLTQVAPMWQEYVRDKMAGRTPLLPDFSRAGYAYSEKPIPRVAGPIFDVTKYPGCTNNASTYCDVAFQRALNDAARANGGVIYFPPGRFKLGNPAVNWTNPNRTDPTIQKTEMYLIQSSNIVIRGAGPTRTDVFMDAATPALNFYEFRFLGPPRIYVTFAARNILRGSTKIYLQSVKGIAPGTILALTQRTPAATNLWFENNPLDPAWQSLITEGPPIDYPCTVVSVNTVENSVTILEPAPATVFMTNATSIRVAIFRGLSEVGVESIKFTTGWKYYPKAFQHHGSPIDDRGWQVLKFENARNCWIRDVVFDSVITGANLESTIGCTLQNVQVAGKLGHQGLTSLRSYGTLMVDTQSVAFHGPQVKSSTTNTVILRATLLPGGKVDNHAKHPYSTLWDANLGGVFTGSGGSMGVKPHHAKYLTVWNFKHRALPNTEESNIKYDLWPLKPGPDGKIPFKATYKKSTSFFQSLVVGLHSQTDRVLLLRDKVLKTESMGTPVLPTSLFEAQLAFRLSNYTRDPMAAYLRTGPMNGTCTIYDDTTFAGPVLTTKISDTWRRCCDYCTNDTECEGWVFLEGARTCTLYKDVLLREQSTGTVAGTRAVAINEGGMQADTFVSPLRFLRGDAPNCSAIDGGWDDWSEWSTCDGACGFNDAQSTRTHQCTNPPPENGGAPCPGDDMEVRPCTAYDCSVAINGSWGPWGQWSSCDGACTAIGSDSSESGERTRRRSCNAPAPKFGGQPCLGDEEEIESCATFTCGTCQCSVWGPLSACDCNTNLANTSRKCWPRAAQKLLSGNGALGLKLSNDSTVSLISASLAQSAFLAGTSIRIGDKCLHSLGENLPVRGTPCDSNDEDSDQQFGWAVDGDDTSFAPMEYPTQSGKIRSLNDQSLCLLPCPNDQNLLCSVLCESAGPDDAFRVATSKVAPRLQSCATYPRMRTVACTCPS